MTRDVVPADVPVDRQLGLVMIDEYVRVPGYAHRGLTGRPVAVRTDAFCRLLTAAIAR